jgi:hypothetical protein
MMRGGMSLAIRHTCDRKSPPAKVVDERGDEPITCIYPTCSVSGKPQAFTGEERAAVERRVAPEHAG